MISISSSPSVKSIQEISRDKFGLVDELLESLSREMLVLLALLVWVRIGRLSSVTTVQLMAIILLSSILLLLAELLLLLVKEIVEDVEEEEEDEMVFVLVVVVVVEDSVVVINEIISFT